MSPQTADLIAALQRALAEHIEPDVFEIPRSVNLAKEKATERVAADGLSGPLEGKGKHQWLEERCHR